MKCSRRENCEERRCRSGSGRQWPQSKAWDGPEAHCAGKRVEAWQRPAQPAEGQGRVKHYYWRRKRRRRSMRNRSWWS
eukprot:14325136-Heterocapsa_arctica.AAC.1